MSTLLLGHAIHKLRRLASIRWFLAKTTTSTHVSAFLSRIDYCNSLLFGSTHDVTSHLQRIQNYVARVILCLPKSSSITSLASCQCKKHLQNILIVLPLPHHYVSLTCCIKGHRTPASLAPTHTSCLFSIDPHTVRQHFVIAHFIFASSSVWNIIPNDVRCAPSLSSFMSRLRTYLFRSVYKDWTFSMITVHMCMVWSCYRFVEGLS